MDLRLRSIFQVNTFPFHIQIRVRKLCVEVIYSLGNVLNDGRESLMMRELLGRKCVYLVPEVKGDLVRSFDLGVSSMVKSFLAARIGSGFGRAPRLVTRLARVRSDTGYDGFIRVNEGCEPLVNIMGDITGGLLAYFDRMIGIRLNIAINVLGRRLEGVWVTRLDSVESLVR